MGKPMDSKLGLQKEIVPVKLSRPRLLQTYPRTHLFTILSQSMENCALWICGPAGSGKTTLVNSFLETADIPDIWYGVDPTDTDIASFFYYMSKAWEKISTDTDTSLPLFTKEFFPQISIFTNRFFTLFSQHVPHPLALVLDNYQAAGEEAQIHEVLCSAIEILQGKISIIICSRTKPPAAFARAKANRTLHVLNWHHLRLQKKEVKGVIRCITHKPYPDAVISELHRKTDGWISGLLLLLLKNEAHDNIQPHQLAHQTPDEIFDYLGSTIFDGLEPEIQTILVRLSYLSSISLDAARDLGGDLACGVLEKLIKKNGFTTITMTNPPEYRFHPLFQEFLQKKAQQFFSGPAHEDLLVRTASILAKEKKSEDAVRLYIRSNQFRKAMNLILDMAPVLASQGRFQTLEEWIDAFPHEVVLKMPWLVFWKGTCKIPTAPDHAKTLLKKALAIFETQADPSGCFMSLSGILDAITFRFDTFRELDRYFEKCRILETQFGITGPPEVFLKLTASMLNALLLRNIDPAETKKWNDRAWQVLLATKDGNLTLQIFSPLILLRIMQGDLCAAGNLLTVFKRITHKKTAPLYYIGFLNIKTFHAWLSADFQEGLTAARQAMKVEKQTGISIYFLGLRAHAALCAMGLGKYDTAKKLLEEVTPDLDQQGLWHQSLYHYALAWLHLLTENITDCRYHALAFFEKTTHSGNEMMLTNGHLLMAKMYYATGERQAAETHLKQSFRFCSRFGSVQDKFMALLTLTTFLLDKKAEKRAEKTLRKAFYLGRTWDYRYSFCWIPREMARLFGHALKNDIEVKYVRSLVCTHHLIIDTPPLDIPNWPWPLQFFSFGGFAIQREETPLPLSRKTRQKPATILKYLMAKGGKNIPEHALQDALWPDSDGDAAQNACKITLHRLRKLLGRNDALVRKQGMLSLNAKIVWTDTLAFQSCCRRIEQNHDPHESLENGLQLFNELFLLYRGPFLCEEQGSWAIPEREKLRSKFLYAIQKIADLLEHQGEWQKAIHCYRQGLEIDPFLESLYPRLMQAYVQTGRKTEALGIFRQCKKILRAEPGASLPEKMHILKQAL